MTWLPKLARDIQDLWRLSARRRLQREAEHQWQNLQHGFGAWPKTCSDFALGKACFLGMPATHPTMATNYPFRPCGIHDNSKWDREDSQSAPASRDNSTPDSILLPTTFSEAGCQVRTGMFCNRAVWPLLVCKCHRAACRAP